MVFRRPVGSKLGRLVLSALVALLAILVLTAALFGLFWGLLWVAGLGEDAEILVLSVVLPIVSVGVIALALQDYQRRVEIAVMVYPDCVTIHRAGKAYAVRFDAVRDVRLEPWGLDAACVLVLSNGQTERLPPEAAPFSQVRAILELVLVSRLADELAGRLANGEKILVGESRRKAWARIAYAAGIMLLGILWMLTVQGAKAGIALLVQGMRLARCGWRGTRGAWELTRQGISPAPKPVPLASPSQNHHWFQLQSVQVDEAGLRLRFADGHTVSASRFASNYWPLAVWLEQRWGGGRNEPNVEPRPSRLWPPHGDACARPSEQPETPLRGFVRQ